ncbi:MAG: endonuclease domain-containing protein [Novosphingobium sp.]
MHDHVPGTVERARRQRREMSLPEVLLWRLLKSKPMGVKFRNQHPLGAYVVDFYCHAAKTVFEIDGISHDLGDQPDFDARRTRELKGLGVEVIRIAASEVLNDPEAAAESIVTYCADRPPPSALRAATSPSGGGFIGASD